MAITSTRSAPRTVDTAKMTATSIREICLVARAGDEGKRPNRSLTVEGRRYHVEADGPIARTRYWHLRASGA